MALVVAPIFSPAVYSQPEPGLSGRTYYLSPEGDDRQPGTRVAPWRTLERASQVQAGATVVFMDGSYPGTLNPQHSGTKQRPIVYRAARRHQARLTGAASTVASQSPPMVRIQGKSHIHIRGFHFKAHNPREARWLLINRDSSSGEGGLHSSHIQILGNLMENSAEGSPPVTIRGVKHLTFRRNVLRDHRGVNMVNVFSSHFLLFEANAFSHASHATLAFSDRSSLVGGCSHIVLRGNIFDPGWGHAYGILGDSHVLMENNIVVHTIESGGSGSGDSVTLLNGGIIRFNRLFRNWGGALRMHPWDWDLKGRGMRVYNNVYHHNHLRANFITRSVEHADSMLLRDNKFENEIYHAIDPHGGQRNISFHGAVSHFLFRANVFASPQGEVQFETWNDREESEWIGLSELRSRQWKQAYGDQFSGSIATDYPGFVRAEQYNHALSAQSPIRDRGRLLTHTVTKGEGRTVPVDDARYFFDGFGIEGEQGDVIAVGHPSQTARVVEADYAQDRLRLDRAVSWKENAPVSFPWSGTKPDPGVYEHGESGRPSVQISVRPYKTSPGKEVHLRAIPRGNISAVSYQWRFADGETATGQEVVRRFPNPAYNHPASPAGYGVWCRVTDSAGRRYLGTGYVEVQDPRGPNEPLLDTRSDSYDNNWWWLWMFEPDPSYREVQFNPKGEGRLRVTPEDTESRLRVPTYLAHWRLDQDPILTFRYKLPPNVPLTVYVEAFPTAENRQRRVYLARSFGVSLPSNQEFSPARLIDDGQWHTIRLDARRLREVYEDVHVMYRFGWDTLVPVSADQGFWLDDVLIGSQER